MIKADPQTEIRFSYISDDQQVQMWNSMSS